MEVRRRFNWLPRACAQGADHKKSEAFGQRLGRLQFCHSARQTRTRNQRCGHALVWEKTLLPLELGDLPYPEGKIIENYLGVPGLELLGEREWKREVIYAVMQLKRSFIADYVVLGGGNVRRLKTVPRGIEKGQNANAFLGGIRLWETKRHSRELKWHVL